MSADPKAPEPGRYRKRPVVVEAVRFDPEQFEALKAAGYPLALRMTSPFLWTAKSSTYCAIESGDYILREPDGAGFYPCAAAVFAATYEAVDGAEAVNAEPPATPAREPFTSLIRQVRIRDLPQMEDDDQGPFLSERDARAIADAVTPNVAGDATPDGPDRPIRSGAGSGEQSRPATPEPAAPMPRVSDERLAQWMSDYEIAPQKPEGPQ